MTFNDVVRMRILNDILSGMSEEEKRDYVLLSNHDDVMAAFDRQDAVIRRVAQKVENQTWLTSFGSDVLANVTTNTAWWLFAKLFNAIKK